MQLFTATFVKNICIFLTMLLQQKLALVMSFQEFSDRCELEVCGSGQNFSNSCGCGAGHKISTRARL